MFLEVHVGVLVGVDELELELVDVDDGADVQVTERVVLGELDRVARLVRLLHAAALQELAASETYVQGSIIKYTYYRPTYFTANNKIRV